MGKILIVPDVHGRRFWEDACYNHKDEYDKIVFLGDYLSPYPDEGISNEDAIETFKDVLKFKKENPEKVVLLFGNHDGSYLNTEICECRTDHKNWSKLNTLYYDNAKLFDLAWETTINGKRYFFSHAGVKKAWLKVIAGFWFKWDDIDKLPEAWYFNNIFHAAYDGDGDPDVQYNFEGPVAAYSNFRGWGGYDNGSIIWADIREYLNGPEYDDVVFVCGHTQLESEPYLLEWVWDLDCRKTFVLDTETGQLDWEE